MRFDELTAECEDLYLFTPGPTYVRKDLMIAAAKMPNFSHRDEEIVKRLKPAFANLKKLAGVDDNYSIILFPGSGTSAMEVSVASLVGDDENVLCVSYGSFGDMYHHIAVASRKRAEKLSFPAGSDIDLNILEDKLKEMEKNGKKATVVLFTHNETSTGVKVDVTEVAKVIKKYGAMPLVDGVSGLGAMPTGIQNLVGMYSSSTQKCLALDAGFGIGIVSNEALEKADYLVKNKKTYPPTILDLTKHIALAKEYQTLTTPNCTLINALYLQMDSIVNVEGVEQRFARHRQMMKMTHDWINSVGNGFRLFPKKLSSASPSVTGLQTPPGYKLKDLAPIKIQTRKDRYVFSSGLPPMNKELESRGEGIIIRIPHMGDVPDTMLNGYLASLKKALLNNLK